MSLKDNWGENPANNNYPSTTERIELKDKEYPPVPWYVYVVIGMAILWAVYACLHAGKADGKELVRKTSEISRRLKEEQPLAMATPGQILAALPDNRVRAGYSDYQAFVEANQ
jgi:hypothetical protein